MTWQTRDVDDHIVTHDICKLWGPDLLEIEQEMQNFC